MYRTKAIILKKTDWQEASCLFTLYTQRFGKITALGRGTKKIGSKLNSSLQFFSVIDLTFAKGKHYDHITGSAIVDNFSFIKSDYRKVIYACYALELVDNLTTHYNLELEVYDLLYNFLKFINQKQENVSKNMSLIKQRFEMKLLEIIGYQVPKDISLNKQKLSKFIENYLQKELKTLAFFKKA